MSTRASDIADRLAANAEAVCRHYLSNGRREGRYWLVGDLRNTPGRSLYVRLIASSDGRGAAGKWTDSATGEHGDLLDIIAGVGSHPSLRDTLAEARRFLRLPPPDIVDDRERAHRTAPVPRGTPGAARRLFAAARPMLRSVAQAYLRRRGIADLRGCDALRFHPRCHYRPGSGDAPDTRTAWPAMIAAVTDLSGGVTGAHRTWLDPATWQKAPVASPRRAMGQLLGNAVRFGPAQEIMAAGEGIETVLSLRQVLPDMPMMAGLSAAHLAAIRFPPTLRRLYVARDADPAGDTALVTLVERARAANIEIVPLSPVLDDFNSDLSLLGASSLVDTVASQLDAADRKRWCAPLG
ncbi:toprim domain-containing protein [Sphingomonas sp. AR_OL41]|uniref:DUF7146 domain-containing protein n=1 Tax=Sphingomonas sp. AR_OL41 TaxID=3042729 RepID=UPI00247FA153|nr:toprim domain-containing protein [Sphingomonas sp. AR_OL41]MDH7973927.1 toprim domain-containing protein [Sphingomonas sp. AR_OL41]